jgi:uncharacterized protein YndB with AHSA1/START domain
MLRRLTRAAVLASPFAATAAWLADRSLRDAAGGDPPPPIRSLAVVDADIRTTWRLLADIERQPEWMHELKSVRFLSPPPVGVGTRAVGRVRILGIGVEDPVEIVEFEPPHRFAIRHEGLFTGGGTITLEAGADGTTTIVRWDERLIPPLLPHLAAVLGRPVFARIFQNDLNDFAALAAREAGVHGGDATLGERPAPPIPPV